MECWLASFPRSGNTFFRNILYYVYGIESSTWHNETAYPIDENYDSFRVVKTHLLPSELIPNDPAIPAIYLVRDGRDSMVSIAHHRKDLISPGSDFIENMKEAIVAAEGSFFGGWSHNVNAWLERAQLVIRYEDLVADPVATFKRVEQLISLPPAKWDQLPGFDQMKSGKPMYGGTSKLIDPKFKADEFAGKFFRKGKAGGWQHEMPPDMQDLFWNHHGDVMERMGYSQREGSISQNATLDYRAMQLLGLDVKLPEDKKFHVLIEATKLTQLGNDGIKRYLVHLLKGLEEITQVGDPRWSFELMIGRKYLPLEKYRSILLLEPTKLHNYEKVLMGFKKAVKVLMPSKLYEVGANYYRKTDVRKQLLRIQKRKSLASQLAFLKELEDKKANIDLLHIPLPQNSSHLAALSHKFVVTVHDLTHQLFPQYHIEQNIDLASLGMKFITDKNADVISVSKSTSADLVKLTGINRKKIHLVYESPDKDLFKWNVNTQRAKTIRENYKLGNKPYLLCLSTIEPRKNLPNTIKAFNLFLKEQPGTEVNLVISGNFGWKTDHLSKELHLDNKNIIFTGYVEDVDLSVLYSEALALCYVSIYEGFGLPPIEAMSCRTPVIYGNNSAMIEVIGDAGLPADANDVNDIKNQMAMIILDKPFRDELAVKAHHRSFTFNWRRTIFDTLKVYEEAISKNKTN